MHSPTCQVSVSLWTLLRVWLSLGAQSWGGGAATLLLIRREVVERRAWIGAEEFTRFWALCQLAPGINLLGLTILIGWRVGGILGAPVALFGLLLPSVAITAGLTAAYAAVQEWPVVQSAFRGVLPATVGLGFLLAWHMGAPLLRQARLAGGRRLILSLLILIGAGVIQMAWHPPVLVVLLGAGAVGALAGWIGSQE